MKGLETGSSRHNRGTYHGDLIADEKIKREEEKMEQKQVVPKEELAIDLDKVTEGLNKIRQFQAVVRKLTVEGSDYGVIPGTSKPTLLKPGAEKIAKLMNLADSYEIMEKNEDYEMPLFAYTIKCRLCNIATSRLISEGIGQCNSWESKYRFRWVFSSDVPEGLDKQGLKTKTIHSTKKNRDYKMYRVDNDDIFSQVNTILKMAKKRALVDAVLSAGRLSEIFTQDMEENATTGNPGASSGRNKEESNPKSDISEKVKYIEQAVKAKETLGDEDFYGVLGQWGMEKFEDLDIKSMPKVLEQMRRSYQDR